MDTAYRSQTSGNDKLEIHLRLAAYNLFERGVRCEDFQPLPVFLFEETASGARPPLGLFWLEHSGDTPAQCEKAHRGHFLD